MTCWNKKELEDMLSDVMEELYSSGSIEDHDYEAITPVELLRLVLKRKDKQIQRLIAAMIGRTEKK